MIETIGSWILIGFCSWITGKGVLTLLNVGEKFESQIDCNIITGLIVFTIYAEVVSIFSGVGNISLLVVILISVVSFVILLKKKKLSKIEFRIKNIIVFAFLVVLISGWTSGSVKFGDTNYHAQAIHWIEEYGLVLGLGNLHNRLAYNSAFLVLQALFSFHELGKSLHTLNGFVMLLLISYSLFTMKFTKTSRISDCCKFGMVVLGIMQRAYFSSDSTDLFAMFLVTWIVIKWVELIEQNIEDEKPYVFLCLVSVYVITLKLSFVGYAIIILSPLIAYIKKKNWQQILKNVLICVVIVLPYVVRNVLISGYLIYPYYNIDLFNVDWKMNIDVVKRDKLEIATWGRSGTSINQSTETIQIWFPRWFSQCTMMEKMLFVLSIVSFVILLIVLAKNIIKKNDIKMCVLITACITNYLLWFTNAPLMRYGISNLVIVITLAVGLNILMISDKIIKLLFGYTSVVYILLNTIFMYAQTDISWMRQIDYEKKECNMQELNGFAFYVDHDNDIPAYYEYVGTPHQSQFDTLEMRGNQIKDGFRSKN